ncbi:BTAD domain-containing putative transcriptional regulator [Streptomyces gibsoniae]|uniref:BTAD domain-containing putative transcriptional regulator n=1 Tax=Streptomyces gibsoniae TaxID=3075529 RepID=A0ABU2TVV6_9ACTN|nr:BTAD domain-containing putative transcriptional regulator [Streptomyces sp. DSM 41699]MDT0464952.1 BTAD domain-containing putative transcriptional regulator [Streptomyces sp. DSM 41699]
MLDRHPVLVVAASAGSGKTTAVVQAAQECSGPVAWVSLLGAPGTVDSHTGGETLARLLAAAVEPQVPNAVTALTDVRARELPASGLGTLLARMLAGTDLVLVIDGVERTRESTGAQRLLGALVESLPSGPRLVLISRTDLPGGLGGLGDVHRVAFLEDRDLAFDIAEATEALRRMDRDDDPHRSVDAMRGWVTGVIHDWWGDDASASAVQHDRLAAELLLELTPAEATLLVRTSLLKNGVTPEQANALGLASADRTMAALRGRRLPLAWSPDGSSMVALPRFRDHLRREIGRLDDTSLRELRHGYARLLQGSGRHEDAVAELLMCGDTDSARRAAERALPDVLGRLDLATAESWLDRMRPAPRPLAPNLAAAGLRVAFGLEQCWRGVQLTDHHGRRWWSGLARQPGGAEDLALLAWCLWHVGRIDDTRDILSVMPPGHPRDIVAALLALADNDTVQLPTDHRDRLSGPLEAMAMRIAYMAGQLQQLQDAGAPGAWRRAAGAPWTVAALRAEGRISEAEEAYASFGDGPRPAWLEAIDAAELMADLGRREEAWAALLAGRRRIAATGSRLYEILSLLLEAKMALRLDHDLPRAARALAQAERRGCARYAFTEELADTWRGLRLLQAGRDADAVAHLAAAVTGMRTGGRHLELPAAAVYLSEALWRTGDDDGADEAADLALQVASGQGSRHLLLQALEDMPSVAARRADAEPAHGSRWHDLVSALSTPVPVTRRGQTLLRVEDFGPVRLVADGREIHPRLAKSVELLAYLMSRPTSAARRQVLLEALFPGRSDATGRSYLRQAVYRLREVLPDGLSLLQDGDVYRLAPASAVVSASGTFRRLLAEAARQDGEHRWDTLRRALAIAERGAYFDSLSTYWLDTQRGELDAVLLQARVDAATVALHIGRVREARRLARVVLDRDPYREQAWRLALHAAEAVGSDDELLDLYRGYLRVMNELGVPPSADLKRLVDRLRR